MKNSVLIIDTDLENCKLIKYNLMNTDTEAYYTDSVSEALQKLQTKQYSLIIMDVLLSTVSGVEMLKVMRHLNDRPLFILSEQASSAERVLALKCGADDVLTKPFDLEECLARAYTLMRRETSRHPTTGRRYVVVGQEDLILETDSRTVSVSGNEIKLTKTEYDILLYLLINRKQVLTYEQIYHTVWKDDFFSDKSIVVYHVHNLRKKLGGNWIEGIYGVGYLMRDIQLS